MENISIVYKKVKDLIPYDKNPRRNDDAVDAVANSIKEFGFKVPIVVDSNDVVVAGHTRLKAAKRLKITDVPVIVADDLSEEQVRAFRLADNKAGEMAEWDVDLLDFELKDIIDIDMSEFGFEFGDDLDDDSHIIDDQNDRDRKSLAEKFVVPPFSVLDTRQGYWQERKRQWKQLGITSENGRDDNLISSQETPDYFKTGYSHSAVPTSIFDPVLCEVCYKWFCVDNGNIIDCFAGGSVRGIVANKLGYQYFGNDLRQEQIDANRENALEVLGDEHDMPVWTCGDSVDIKQIMHGQKFDMLFTCPPYADLEVYSDDPRDISNMDYDDFISVYREIIKNTCDMLKDDRFAVIVVGDVRDKKGFYRDFIGDTKQAFYDAGLKLYNELILVEQIGTGAMRAEKTILALRKVVKIHQNVLVFYKGDIKRIKDNFKMIEVNDIVEDA